MQFNSITYLLFFILFFILYWGVLKNSLKHQNLLILVASYVFYGWWDYRFLGLIFISTLIDFFAGKAIEKSSNFKAKKGFLILSLLSNLGLLGFFKYFNFFIENFQLLSQNLGFQTNLGSLEIILPVGISFYTFQTMSYSIDVYNGKIKSSNNFIEFAAYVSFFPQLVAGPIERATHLLPQFQIKKSFNYQNAVEGLRQILWGLFKKMFVADNCAEYANLIFNTEMDYSGSTYAIGAILFSFQIYGDFSGYSDIAIGSSKVFGFQLMQNFKLPYFSKNIDEFWKKWHISLSTWFRDYVYIPLGGNRVGFLKQIRNVFIVFLISGFWHGANWTFISWGFVHAMLFIPLLVISKIQKHKPIELAIEKFKFSDVFKITLTYVLVTLCWVFFRAENMSQALDVFKSIFSKSLFTIPSIRPSLPLISILILIIIEWITKNKSYPLENIEKSVNQLLRYFIYIIFMIVVLFFYGANQQFIYFQF